MLIPHCPKIALVAFLVAALASNSLANGEVTLKSGPQRGGRISLVFNSLGVNGYLAGKSASLVQHLWYSEPSRLPFTLIFARIPNKATMSLIKKLDDEAVRTKTFRVGVVFLSDEKHLADLAAKLKVLVEKEKLQAAIVSLEAASNLVRLKIAKEATETVIFCRRPTEVVGNMAFRKGKLAGKAINKIVEKAKKLMKK